jgi:hypothetical protein
LQPHGLHNTKREGEVVCADSQEPATVETMELKWVTFLLLVLNQFFKPNIHFALKTCIRVCDSNICDIYQSTLMTNIKIQPYLQHNQAMINAKHSHVRYTGWLGFCQRLPVGSETGRAVNKSTIFLEPVCDMFLPFQSPYWCRIKSRQQSQI